MSLVISWSGGFLYESESSGLENHLFSMYLAVKKPFLKKYVLKMAVDVQD